MLCIYCNLQEGVTDDHIIPKQLYPKPWPNDFITVPACQECNYSFRKDEEYFRIALTGSLQAQVNSVAAKNVLEGPVLRAFERRPSLVGVIAKDVKLYPALNEDKTNIFFVPGYPLDKNRVDTVVRKIIKALFFIEKRKVLPPNYEILTNIDADFSVISDDIKTQFASQPIKKIGENQEVFEYVKLDVMGKEYLTAWMICFYKCFCMFAATMSKEKAIAIRGNRPNFK